MKRTDVALAMACLALTGAGCDALLGLDDKQFGTSTTSAGGGGSTSSSGGGGGGQTTSSGGGGTVSTGGATGGTTGGGGAGGALPCAAGAQHDRVTDEFDFPLCVGEDTSFALKERGWHLAWQEEQYFGPFVGLVATNNELRVTVDNSVYWFNGEIGPFIEKKLTGDFLIVADAALSTGMDPNTLPDSGQAGAGILVRDPASVSTALERWVAVDRGTTFSNPKVHGSWSNGEGSANQDSLNAPLAASGKIALCRKGGQFHIYAKDGNAWIIEDALIAGGPSFTGEAQVGLFLYVYDEPKKPYPNGVQAHFAFVHQYDLVNGSCDPSKYFE